MTKAEGGAGQRPDRRWQDVIVVVLCVGHLSLVVSFEIACRSRGQGVKRRLFGKRGFVEGVGQGDLADVACLGVVGVDGST